MDPDALLDRTTSRYLNGGPKEGIVIRPTESERSKLLDGPFSMEVINNRYLLKYQD